MPPGQLITDLEGIQASELTLAGLVQKVGSKVKTLLDNPLRKERDTVSFISNWVAIFTELMVEVASVKGFKKFAVVKLGIRSLNLSVYWEISTMELKEPVNYVLALSTISPVPKLDEHLEYNIAELLNCSLESRSAMPVLLYIFLSI